MSSCCDAVNFGFQGWVCVWVGEICFTGFVMHEHEEPGVYIDWLSLVYSTLALKLWEHFIQHVSSQLYTQTHSHIFIQAHFICLSECNSGFSVFPMQPAVARDRTYPIEPQSSLAPLVPLFLKAQSDKDGLCLFLFRSECRRCINVSRSSFILTLTLMNLLTL